VLAVRDHLGELRAASTSSGETGPPWPQVLAVSADLRPVVISFVDDADRLSAYREHLAVDFPVVADPDRLLYRALGAERGRLRDVWSRGTLRMYVDLIRKGRKLRRPRDDTRQLGADAVVGPDGRLEALWLPASPDTRPSITEIAATIRRSR
jgi:hypothetical protein